MGELAKNQIYTAEITGYSSTGAGVCRIEGRAVFVDKALVGEVWELIILKVSSSAVYAKGTKLLKSSDERVSSACPIFGKCGGCDLMHMSYKEELRFKLDRVNEVIRRVAGLPFHIDEIIGAPEDEILRYRNKAIFAVGQDESGKAQTGFFRERSHSLIPAEDCLIQTELSVRCAAALRRFMDKTGATAYDESTGKGQIRHIFTRCSKRAPQSVACVVSARGLHENTQELVKCLREDCPELTGIVLCINKSKTNTVLSGDFHTLWGSEIIEDELCGLRFKISPLSFYQINPLQAEKLYTRALEYAGEGGSGTVLDLYCGAGTISLCLARGAKFVYGAEIEPSSVLNARQNAEANGIKNVEFLLGDAGEAAKKLSNLGVKPETIVVDPPRKGLTTELIDEICAMSPDKVVYVSCDSATLARDLKLFSERSYLPQKGTAVDMFPRTSHTEVCCLIEKA